MDEHNAEAIDALRRRQFWVASLFYGSLAAIPLGVLCPCGLAAVVYRLAPEWSQPVALSSFLLPLVGVAGALLPLGERSRLRRSLALARLADALGLRFTRRADKGRLAAVAAFPFLNLLRTPHSESGANLLEGTYRRRPLTLVFGLPGNPVSTFVCFELFVRPALRRLRGLADSDAPLISAVLTEDFAYRTDRPTYHPARLEVGEDGWRVRAVPWFGSADLRGLLDMDALVVLPAGDHRHTAGTRLPAVRLEY